MIIYLLVFFSGFCALVYQVLWMKQLALLFGNTSHAAGVTLAAFFAGLAAGSWFWGRRSAVCRNPMRVFAGLEFGIAITALLYFAVIRSYHVLYPEVYQSVHSGVWLLLIKFVLALLLIFPPAFCMGGTIPVMGQYVIRVRSSFGATSALLYGVNTMGATLGALLAGFFMPFWFGFRATCLLAMGITLLVAIMAYRLARSAPGAMERDVQDEDKPSEQDSSFDIQRIALRVICFFSGFGVLSLEVLWTRMFALVFENSVYTFAAILVVVLSCLAGGSLISSLLARRKWPPNRVLALLLVLSGLSISVTPLVFMEMTGSFQFHGDKMVWSQYVLMIFLKCAITIGPPALILGTVFPYLMKTEERYAASPGWSLGRLAMVNTIGAILGSLLCAFLLLEYFGLWASMMIVGVIYFLMAIFVPSLEGRIGLMVRGLSAAGLVLLLTGLNSSHFPATGTVAGNEEDEILKTWEGSDCTVSVVRNNERGLVIMINSDYGLGSTSSWRRQAAQAEIPLMLRPGSESIFFLGMGTGISAGAALSDRFPQVQRVVTCELSPHVITAAREFMTDVDGVDLTNGLFQDRRSKVLTEDGRHFLMATDETFDLIIGDLFLPYRSSSGSLYTREHFECVQDRLNPGGLFVQWLPAYQVTDFEFHVIGRTMLEVFDQVSLWRRDFVPFNEVVAFVGHQGGEPLPASSVDDSAAKLSFLKGEAQGDIYKTLNPQTALVYYAGNVRAAEHLFANYPINTDDRPVIQYQAPRQYREQGEERLPWFVGPFLLKFIKQLQEACPPAEDPLLVNRSDANRRLPLAGSAYHEANLWSEVGKEEEVNTSWKEFVNEWLDR
jgi:spermidine synthase